MDTQATAGRGGVRQPRIFYGWWIVLAGTAMLTLMATFSYYGMGVFFEPMRAHFGWSALALGTALSFARLEGGFAAPLVGYLIDRLGPRKLMLVGVSIGGFGYVALSQTTSLPYFYIVYIALVQGGISIGMGNAPTAAVANWFQRKRGAALGIVNLGASFGGILAAPLAWLIEKYDWNGAFLIAGLLTWAIGLPLALVVRHRPEPYGYLPDGRQPVTAPAPVAPESATSPEAAPAATPERVDGEEREVEFTAKQALRTMAFWSIGLTFAARQLVTGSVALFLIPFLLESDMTGTDAALIITYMSIIGMPGRVGFAWLGDHYDKRWVIAFCFVFQSTGLILFTVIGGTLGIIFFLFLYAPAYSGVLPLLPAIQADYFGRKWFATIRGMMAPIGTVAVVAGPVLAGSIHTLTGSYRPAFFVLAVANVVALVFIVITRRPRDPALAK